MDTIIAVYIWIVAILMLMVFLLLYVLYKILFRKPSILLRILEVSDNISNFLGRKKDLRIIEVVKIAKGVCSQNKMSAREFIGVLRNVCNQDRFSGNPTVWEFIKKVKENGFQAELDFLKSIDKLGAYERLVELAFRYERSHLIYC